MRTKEEQLKYLESEATELEEDINYFKRSLVKKEIKVRDTKNIIEDRQANLNNLIKAITRLEKELGE